MHNFNILIIFVKLLSLTILMILFLFIYLEKIIISIIQNIQYIMDNEYIDYFIEIYRIFFFCHDAFRYSFKTLNTCLIVMELIFFIFSLC